MQRRPRQYDPDYLARVRTWLCISCLDNTSVEACHIRLSDASVCKVNPGVGQKPDDKFVLPMCSECHREQHSMQEKAFWDRRGIDPVKIALALYAARDSEEAERIIRAQHPMRNILAAG